MTRRACITAGLSGICFTQQVIAMPPPGRFMPDESDPHQRTWMAFGASQKIWGAKLLPEVQRNLATIARTIARFEPVSMLVREADFALAKKLVGPTVELISAPLNDLWMRDTGPVFLVTDAGEKSAVDFNFNGWGEKQEFALDAKVAELVAQRAGVKIIETDLILEGGGIEVDGDGTAIIAESCVLNTNRNPRVTKAEQADFRNCMTFIGSGPLQKGQIDEGTSPHEAEATRCDLLDNYKLYETVTQHVPQQARQFTFVSSENNGKSG